MGQNNNDIMLVKVLLVISSNLGSQIKDWWGETANLGDIIVSKTFTNKTEYLILSIENIFSVNWKLEKKEIFNIQNTLK